MHFRSVLPFLLALPAAHALPTPARRGILDDIKSIGTSAIKGLTNDTPDNKAPTTAIDPAAAVTQFLRPALFAQTAYCSSKAVTSWTCGPPCDALGKIEVLQAGGDNGLIPRYFLAHDPSTESVIVAHQGTDSKNILSIVNDLKFKQIPLNASIFPNQPTDALVHDGFADTQQRTADEVLCGVRSAMMAKNATKVHVIGHSLGAAIAVMDAVMIAIAIPEAELTTTVFGLPRGGNSGWADLVNKLVKNLTYVTNQLDPVPTLPPRFLDFVHPTGEVHIVAADARTGEPTNIVSCSDRDNEGCSTGTNLLQANVSDHKTPYFRNDIIMAGNGCPL